MTENIQENSENPVYVYETVISYTKDFYIIRHTYHSETKCFYNVSKGRNLPGTNKLSKETSSSKCFLSLEEATAFGKECLEKEIRIRTKTLKALESILQSVNSYPLVERKEWHGEISYQPYKEK